MGFLTPLYILGLAGLALPIVFHLIRRTPRGQQQFSSLMFLTPSPPRLTRRSRLDNLLLLLLRALILLLLVLAFARPFLREIATMSFQAARGRRIALLVDTSASMQRSGLWRQAVEAVDEVLTEAKEADRVALFTFDEAVTAQAQFEDLDALIDETRRESLIRKKMQSIKPSWAQTDLGGALVHVADVLDAENEGEQTEVDAKLQIILISDFQAGSQLETLQSFEWPKTVMLEVRPVTASSPTNAGMNLIKSRQTDEFDQVADQRVRVTNDSRSIDEQFWVDWARTDSDKLSDDAVPVSVPAGESRVVKAPARPDVENVDRLRLIGDDQEFDNTVFVAWQEQREWTILYVGSDDSNDANGLRYYLERAFPETRSQKIVVESQAQDEPLKAYLSPPMVVITEPLDADRLTDVKKFLDNDGVVLAVLGDVKTAESIAPLLFENVPEIHEADVSDYAMLGDINFRHSMFAPFANPRYSDFTQIRFWGYREIDLPSDSGIKILARFDSGAPAVLEKEYGRRGRMIVLASSWNPADSQLALSSKFVPLLSGILQRAVGPETNFVFQVGDTIPITDLLPDATTVTVTHPGGSEIKIEDRSAVFRGADQPGIYRLDSADGRAARFAVNLAIAESLTSPLDAEELEQRGVNLGRQLTAEEEIDRDRQLRNTELERQQQIWRWLIVAALVILIVETWLAGRLARRATE